MSCRAAFDELSSTEADGPEEMPAVMRGRKTDPCQGAAPLGDPEFPSGCRGDPAPPDTIPGVPRSRTGLHGRARPRKMVMPKGRCLHCGYETNGTRRQEQNLTLPHHQPGARSRRHSRHYLAVPERETQKVKGRLFERTGVIKIKSISSAEPEPLEGYEAFPSCSPLLFLCRLPRLG